jgi:uncharacterized protein YcbK (DUF882 family)
LGPFSDLILVHIYHNDKQAYDNHPEERKKATPGAHSFGKAMDVVIDGQKCHKILMLLSKYKFTGVGIGIRAGKNMLHLDMCTVADAPHFTARPNVWTY